MRKFILCLLFVAACAGAGADSPSNPSYIPAEWYQNLSLFFRTATNPPKVIPVMASDGYRLPVALEGAVSVTVGSATFTAMPIYSNSAGSATLGLVDLNRRVIVNIGSDTSGLLEAIASITAGVGQPFTQDLESSATASTVANIANRSWICIQNKSTSEPVFINNDTVATPGYGLKLFPGGSFTRAWGAGVPVTFVSTNSAMIFVDQEVSP